jgi:NitT/TauT family transport system permease protein
VKRSNQLSTDVPALAHPLDDDRSSRFYTTIMPIMTLLCLIGTWEALVRWFEIQSWLLPAPSEIGRMAMEWRRELAWHSAVTLYETMVGFGLSLLVGVPLAVAVVYSRILQNTIYPILLALQSMPKVAIAPLLTLWIGFGALPKIIVVFLVCFFPIVVATTSGLATVRPVFLELVQSLCATSLQVFIKVRFPSAMPSIFVGMKIAITLAVIGAVIGEFVGAQDGLGYLILISSTQSRTALAFAALVLLTLMSIVLYYAIEILEHFVAPWGTRR